LFIFYFFPNKIHLLALLCDFVVVEKEGKHKRRKVRETKGCTQQLEGKRKRIKNYWQMTF